MKKLTLAAFAALLFAVPAVNASTFAPKAATCCCGDKCSCDNCTCNSAGKCTCTPAGCCSK